MRQARGCPIPKYGFGTRFMSSNQLEIDHLLGVHGDGGVFRIVEALAAPQQI